MKPFSSSHGDSPQISVITTAYNAENFVAHTVNSILNQTYSDFEYIIVDDGSCDQTTQIIESFNDPRIHLIIAGRVGRGKALNIGLREAQGKYIAIQDADDLSHPQRLEIQHRIMTKTERDVALGTEAIRIDNSQCIRDQALQPIDLNKLNTIDVTRQIFFYNPIKHTSAFMKRSILLEIDGYNENRKNLFDWDMLFRYVEAGGKLYLLSAPLIFKRQHRQQFFESRKRITYVFSSIIFQYGMFRDSNKTIFLVLLPVLMCYRLLPLKFRMAIRNLIGK